MKTRLAVLVAVTLCVATQLHGSEDAVRVNWVRSCLGALASQDADVRASGGEAIAKLGPAAAEVLAPALSSDSMKGWSAWKLLERALIAGESVERTVESIARSRSAWPPAHARKLAILLAALRAQSADRIKVANNLLAEFAAEDMFTPEDDRIGKLVGLGRPIVPLLLRVLRSGVHRGGFADEAAAAAMSRIATDADVPAIGQLLQDGHLVAARALRGRTSPLAKEALLQPLKKGLLSADLLDSLRAFGHDKQVERRVVDWLRSHGRGGGLSTRDAASFSADQNFLNALPVLRSLLAAESLAANVRAGIAASCAKLGDKRGIEVLVEIICDRSPLRESGVARYHAGRELNFIVGRRVYAGKYGDRSSNAREAATWFRDWWKKHAERITFDGERRVWLQGR